ncbi:hypothetical protein DWW20_17290 [Ruminococcus sp. AF14-5]|nr:hypothetical protein DWW20_17290 [Ruminococcus sp. AF14-5]
MTKLTKKQINRIAAAAFAAVMATSMTIPAFASGNVLASEAPNGLYSSTAGNSNLYTDYQNNQVGSSEGSTSFRIPEAESSSQSNGESYVTTFDKFGESSDPSENIGQDSYVSVIPPETSTSAVDYYDGYDYDADYSTGDATTEDVGDMTTEDPVTTPAETSAEIVGEWFGVLGSSPVKLALAGDYTYCLNLLDVGETTSGTYTTNGSQVALQLNDGIVMTLEVAADAKTMTAVDSVEGTLAKASAANNAETTTTEDSFEGAWQATDAVVTSKFEVTFPGIDEGYGFQESSKSYSLADIDDISHMTVYIQDGTLDFYINKCDGSYVSFEGMKTTLNGNKLYFENSGNMTKLQGYVKDCDDGAGKDIVFETDGKDITFHLTTECNDAAEAPEYATDDVIPYAQEDYSADESVSADDVQNNGGYIVQSFGYQD